MEEADRQRTKADEMFQEARNAVDIYFNNVSEDLALQQDEMVPLRQKLLTSALDYYRKFILERANDPNVRRELAEAYRRAGCVAESSPSANNCWKPR